MPETTHALVRRRDATQAVLDRRIGQPFAWGTNDCATLAADILSALGHAVPPVQTRYRSASGARAALRARRVKSLAEALDALGLPRIPPAAALAGDLIAMPGHEHMTALGVSLGTGRVLAFHEDVEGACVIQPTSSDAAWRVIPLG